MNNNPTLYDSAYPGSMHVRDSGDFVKADDNASLANTLLRNLHDTELSRDDWRCDALKFLKQRDKLIQAAQAVIDRWDSPMFNTELNTVELITKLRDAVAKAKE